MTRLDTRDLTEELDELIDRRDNPDDHAAGPLDDVDAVRILALVDLLEEIGDEARYGVALIPESEFEDYARELAEDIGAVPEGGAWPTYCIDWEWAARELRQDYSSIDFDGESYLYRA